ncbi:MAG: hypothetical protein LBC86_08180 [Oscillospiraceae bacterium]|jgi:hypothetical protein|nr:hypothetical protein [Oscillospiraceae bacterium]
MNDILEELYYGNINPNTQQKSDKHLMKKISKSHEELLELLNGREKELFEQCLDFQRIYITQIKLDNFKMGYQLGSWLTAEIYN